MDGPIKISYFESLRLLRNFCDDSQNIEITEEISALIAGAFRKGNKVIIAGNGGSACDAMHFAEEFTGRFRKDRRALPVISLTDPAHITCVGNDYGFENIFERGVEAYGSKGDIFIGLSTSGNSENIIKAVKKCRSSGIKTVALLGKDGGKLKGACDFEFIVPAETSDRVQEIHMIILHIIIEGIERVLFPENY